MICNPEQVATLNPTFEHLLERPLQGRNIDLRSQRRLADCDRHLANEVDAVTMEKLMVANANHAVEVAARRSRVARFPFSGHANGRVGVDTRWHADFQCPLGGHTPLAAARGTRVGHNGASAATGAARLLNAKKALALDDDTLTVAAPARAGPCAAAGAAARAFLTDFFAGDNKETNREGTAQ